MDGGGHMYELMQVGEHTYYIQSPAKIGLVELAGYDVCLIDSGNDKSAGRKVRQILDAHGWNLVSIYNTHSHADHIGGNQYLQSQTGCAVYAPGLECAFTRHPLLEPVMLYGGFPPDDLRHKFLMAQESPAEYLTADVLPEGFDMIPLPGHAPDMVGLRTPDDIVFLADCLSGAETLNKYGIGYTFDIAAYLKTLEDIQHLSAKLFIPSHAEPTENIVPLAQMNIAKVWEIAECIVSLCVQPACFESILQRLFESYHLNMTFEQYALIGSTLRSYLTWLRAIGKLDARIENNQMVWIRL